MKPNGSKGFTLIEMVIVMGLGSLVALAVTQMVTQQFKAMESIRVMTEANNLYDLTKLYLQNPASCKKTVAANNLKLDNSILKLSNIADASGDSVIGVYSDLHSVPAKTPAWISDISSPAPIAGGPNGSFNANFKVTIEKAGDVMGGKTIKRDVWLSFQTDAAGNIKDCSAGLDSVQLAQVCSYLGGTLNGESCNLPAGTKDTPKPAPVTAIYQCPTYTDNCGGYRSRFQKGNCNGQVSSVPTTCTRYIVDILGYCSPATTVDCPAK